MKNTIYLITITALFIACKPNINNEATTETAEVATEAPKAIDTTKTSVQAIEQPNEIAKLDLPFIGKRNFAFTDGVVNDNFITIKSDGMVMFSSSVVNFDKNDNPNGYKEAVYFKGKYADIIKETPNGTIIVVKESTDYNYYKIEGNRIYMVDKNGVKDKGCIDDEKKYCEGTTLEKI